jgi:phosphatidylglycerol:prolipoprotein diacylglycerol transferase
MYPYDVVLGFDLYDLSIVVGFFAALVFFRFWADRRNFSVGLQNLCIVGALVAIVGGYGLAVVTQAFYNFMESGRFEIASSTGATFYGGLIGGAGSFLLVYFVGGAILLKNREHLQRFFSLSEIAAGSIALAHGFGRIGCLFAGCCYGKVTDAWYGVYNVYLGQSTVPVQLFEAMFLFALAFYLSYRLGKQQKGNLGIYLIFYAVWRFLVEFLRDDHRGETIVSFLSPSQLVAIVLILVGVGLWWLEYRLAKRSGEKEAEGDDEA